MTIIHYIFFHNILTSLEQVSKGHLDFWGSLVFLVNQTNSWMSQDGSVSLFGPVGKIHGPQMINPNLRHIDTETMNWPLDYLFNKIF